MRSNTGGTLNTGDYILWFAQYGSITHQRMFGPLKKIIDWAARMDEESTGEFDSHGIPIDLELVGTGIVENFHALVTAREAELKAERKAWADEYQKRQAAAKSEPQPPTYSIYLKPPPAMAAEHKHLSRYRRGVVMKSRLPFAELVAERDRLEEIFGKDRITVQEAGVSV